ncbi:MAG: hypothetical protein OXC63_08465 [Aestuariivita sp.]|nr:hypothetical protein [Aestuariivita sp.]MCY4345424.1 hypothetical protein [Aestuariivita sp.]
MADSDEKRDDVRELEGDLSRWFFKERRRQIRAAHKVRWFDYRIPKLEVCAGLKAIRTATPRPSARRSSLTKRFQKFEIGAAEVNARLKVMNDAQGSASGATEELGELQRLEAEIARALSKAEKDFIFMTGEAGWFEVRILTADMMNGLEAILAMDSYPASQWDRLKQKRSRILAKTRSSGVRIKAILGGFVVAQCRHKPELHRRLAVDIRQYLGEHPYPKIAAKNLEILAGFLADPHDGGVSDANKETAPEDARARNHRQILLGTWLLARKDDDPSIARLIEEELEGFLAESPVKVSPSMFQDLLN